MRDALPVATLPIFPGLEQAQVYAGLNTPSYSCLNYTIQFSSMLKWMSSFLMAGTMTIISQKGDILHWVIDEAKCILVMHVCVSVRVCLFMATFPHYCTDQDDLGMVGGTLSCALLGGFAIGARVSLLWQHSSNVKYQRVLVLALCLVRLTDIGKSIWPCKKNYIHHPSSSTERLDNPDSSGKWMGMLKCVLQPIDQILSAVYTFRVVFYCTMNMTGWPHMHVSDQ